MIATQFHVGDTVEVGPGFCPSQKRVGIGTITAVKDGYATVVTDASQPWSGTWTYPVDRLTLVSHGEHESSRPLEFVPDEELLFELANRLDIAAVLVG